MRQYIFEVIINEAKDEFWEDLEGSGCDKIAELVNDGMHEHFAYEYSVKLKRYNDVD